MISLSDIGRVFYGIAMAVLGFLAIFYQRVPYMLMPPIHSYGSVFLSLVYIFGALLLLAGVCIAFNKMVRQASLLLGSVLLLICCFWFIPYQFTGAKSYVQFGDWENVAKELALSAGGFVIASCFPRNQNNFCEKVFGRLVPFGSILYAICIISFSIDHFLYAKEAADYVPRWIPYHIFWMYFCGVALLGAGVAIILKIKTKLFASLLGSMILIWFIILHIPYVINASSSAARAGEAASACLALAYSGIAFVIAGSIRKTA